MPLYINLWELIKKRWITAVKLAELTWLTPEHISVLKNWKTKQIKLSTIEKLIKNLEVSPNDLFKF